jgi:GNAT superfamily N-acetyltransferase
VSIDVRPLGRSDVRDAARVLAKAFYDDPVTSWMLPDDSSRLTALTRAFGPLARHHFVPRAGSEVGVRDGTVGAATLWDPPGHRKPGLVEQLITMPAMLWSFRSRVPASMRVMELMEKHHPEEPHWYLMLIGSDPSVRGAGFGHALMRSRLDRCDERVVLPAVRLRSHGRDQAAGRRAAVVAHVAKPALAPGVFGA